MSAISEASTTTRIPVPHFVRGRLVWGDDCEYLSRTSAFPS